jgi:8-oxo-dGTP pyrophosphatase MutT (NUDIX family)
LIRLDDIDRALGAREPTVADPGSAVAAILCNAESPQLLFIERARVEGDPWSGDIAFPGGRVEPQDDGLQAAAERETQEEIGLDLGHGRYIGRLDDLVTQSLGIQVAAFVYAIDDDDGFQLSHEVAAAFWRPLSHLTDPARQFSHTFASRGFPRNLPAIDLLGPGKPPLWGITYRFVAQLMRLAGHPLPES